MQFNPNDNFKKPPIQSQFRLCANLKNVNVKSELFIIENMKYTAGMTISKSSTAELQHSF